MSTTRPNAWCGNNANGQTSSGAVLAFGLGWHLPEAPGPLPGKGAYMRLQLWIPAGAVVVALVAGAGSADAQGLFITGYADFEASFTNPDGDGNSDFFLDNHHFNLIMIGKLFEDLFAAAEVEFEHAGEEIALEYAYFGYTGIPNVRIMAGKFIVPFGRFNKDLHPTFINKMPDRPHGFSQVLPQTYNDVGLWVSGTTPSSEIGARLVFDAFVVNGLMGDDAGSIRGGRDNDRERRAGERDDNKAVGGRLGLEFAPQGVDLGASVYHGNFSNDPAVKLDLTLLGVDFAFRKSGFELRGEVVTARQEITTGDPLRKTGGYGQVAYFVTPRIEPVIRFSMQDFPDDSDDLRRLSFGVNVHITAASSARFAYHLNMEKSGFGSDNNAIVLQWNVIL